MAEITRKQTQYMTRAEFDALDKTTVDVGTEICIVDQIQKEDLSTDLQNAITSAETLPEEVQILTISAPAAATNGIFTDAEFNILQMSDNVSIMFNHEKYYLNDNGHIAGYKTYTHVGYENNSTIIKAITVTISTKSWVLNTTVVPTDIPTSSGPSWHTNTLPDDTSKVLMTKVLFTSNDDSNPLHAAYGLASGLCDTSMDATINCIYYETGAQYPTYGILSGYFTYSMGQDIEVQFSGLFLHKQFNGTADFQATAEESMILTVTCDLLYLW